MSTTPDSLTPPPPRRSRRRLFAYIGLGALGLIILLALAGLLWLRSDRFNRFAGREIDQALRQYGLRAEIGDFDIGRGLRTATLRNVKIYNLQTGQLIATVDRATVALEVREPFALRLSREVVFQKLDVEGLDVRFDVDEKGQSNFFGVHQAPPRAPGRITFDYSSLTGALARGAFHYTDRQRNMQAELTGLHGRALPVSGSTPPKVTVELASGTGSLSRDDHRTTIDAIEFAGRVMNSGAEIDKLALRSAMAEANLSGHLDDWQQLKYQFDTQASVRLDQVVDFLAPGTDLAGTADFKGHIAGAAMNYRINGQLTSDELAAAGIIIRGAQADNVFFEPQQDHFHFGSTHAHARAVTARAFSVSDASIVSVNGKLQNGRTELTAPQASVSRLTAAQGQAAGVTLRNVSATLGSGVTEAKGDLQLSQASFGKISVGQTKGRLSVTQNEIALGSFNTSLLGGTAKGTLNFNTAGGASRLQADFTGLKTSDVFSVVAVKSPPLAGTVTGRADVNWPGANVRLLSGDINAQFSGQTTDAAGAIPLTGEVATRAQRGVFNFDNLTLRTDASTVNATGALALSGDSDLRFTVTSTRAEELQTIFNSFGVADQLMATYEPQLLGDFNFTGTLNGPLSNPTVAGDLNASTFAMHDETLGSVSGHLLVSPAEIRFENGLLTAQNGGTVKVTYAAPRDVNATAGRLDATIERMNADALIIAAGLPTQQKLIEGEVSGEAHLTGLPAAPQGNASVSLVNGTVVGQPAEAFTANVVFDQQTARLNQFEVRLPQGRLTASGSYDFKTSRYQVQGQAEQVDLSRLAAALELSNVQLSGTASANFQASGDYKEPRDFKVELNAQGQQVAVNGHDAGEVKLTARTNPGGRIDIDLTTNLTGNPQPVTASIEWRQPGRPIEVRSDLNNFDLAPVLAIFAPGLADNLAGNVTGTLRVSGPLLNEKGEMTADNLRGNLTLTDIALQVAGNPVSIATPFTVSLSNSQLSLESTRITAQGTDLRIGGTLGLRENAALNFALTGTVRPDAFISPGSEVSLGGTVTIDARASGTFSNPQLNGDVRLTNLSFSTLDSPVTLEEGNGRIALAGNRVVLENFTARAGDGTVQAGGTLTLAQLQPEQWQFTIKANDVDVLYRGVRATADAQLQLAGTQQSQTLSGTVTVPLAEYTSDFNFTETAGGRGGLSFGGFKSGSAGGGGGFLNIPPVDLNVRVEANNSLIVRNEQVNTVASATLNLSGTLSEPDVSGRVMLEGGTVTFRGERYDITAGTLELPGGFGAQPELNLVAEGEVSSYRVYVGFNGRLNDLEVTLRSEPDLTRAEIISLITTGRTETGTLSSDDLVRSGIGTAASLLTQELISKPVQRETEKLIGINRFQIDPVLRANENPAARLTIGRQIARGLSFTYSTNLASEQDQTAIFEYNFSNRFSALASYTQGGSATRQGTNDNDFTIEIRGRKRFSLGADRSNASAVAAAAGPPRIERRPLPPALVDLNKPDTIKLSDNRLRELLPVKREGFSRALTRLGERNLTNYLQEQGYFFAEVDSRCEPVTCSGPDLRVIYDVSPGARYSLSDIRIEGTKALNKGEVKSDLQSQESSLLASVPFLDRLPFVGGYARGITSNDRLRNDREVIRERLADLGYRSARVDAHLAVSPNNENLVVIFDVTEGPRSSIADVAVRGNTIIPATELRDAVPFKSGADFSPTDIREGAQRIRDAYTRRGYLDAKTDVSVIDLPDNRVRVMYEVTEGARAIVQQIEVKGQAITQEDALRRFIDFKPGDVLTPQILRNLQRDLYATGAFREVSVRPEPIPGGDPSDRRVTLSVTEAKPLLLVYGLGYSTDDGARVLGQLTHTNLFGRVISGSLKLRGSRREQLAQLQFTDLRPMGKKWPVTFSAFYNRNADLRPFVRRIVVNGQEQASTPGRTFGINRFATFVQTEHKLSEVTSLRFRYSFENAKLFNLENIPVIEVTRNERATRLGLFSAGISRDTRDSALNPTRGQLFSADHSLATRILGGNESFNKFFGNYQRYDTLPAKLPLLGNSIFAFSARLGLAGLFKPTDRDRDGVISDAEKRLPISERFFAGGATTLRGFRFEEAGPQGILEPRNANELPTLVPLGGDALAVFNFELRYPLTRRVQLVPFYDLGNVFRRVSDIGFGNMTNTVGVGLRVTTPIGPVGVDYGYLLDPPAFVTASGGIIRQPRGVFHIRIGQTF